MKPKLFWEGYKRKRKNKKKNKNSNSDKAGIKLWWKHHGNSAFKIRKNVAKF